jgi:hypothetical protein
MFEQSFYHKARLIDNAIMNGIINQSILELIQNEAYNNYFFKNITKNVQTIKWFKILKDNKYFSPEKAPGPQPADKEDLFVIPQWNVLPYLEKVSEQLKEAGNERYIDELITVIENVSTYKDADGNHIDNYRTWWYFVKILINIPADKIPIEVIDLIPIWLGSKFDTSLPGADILNKLLPKFLEDIPTAENITKAERIVKYVTALKPIRESRKRKSLIENDKFECVIEFYWLEQAFKKYGQQIGEKCSAKVVTDLCGKMRKVLKKKEGKTFFSDKNRSYLITLQEKKEGAHKLKVFDIGSINKEKSYEEAFEEIAKGKKSRRKFLTVYIVESEDVCEFVQNAYKILKQNPSFLTYQDDELNSDLYNLYISLYSNETYRSLYEEPRYHMENVAGLLTSALKKILLTKATKDNSTTNKILKSFFKDRYLYFPKMALYAIGNTGNIYIDRFWELFESEGCRIILDGPACEDELRHVLQIVAGNLTKEQEKILETAIERGPLYVAGDDRERWINMWKQERYAALTENPYFKLLHEELTKITGTDVQLRPAISMGETWVGPGSSALSKEKILQMPNIELAEFLSSFREMDHWQGPTARGLAEMLKQVVQDKPDKFVDNFKPFLNTGYLYMYYMFWGLKDAWANKKEFDWQKLFNFIKEYLDQDEFWRNELPMVDKGGWNPDHETVVGEISELIQEGAKDDTRAFPDTLFEDAKKILWLIMDRLTYPPASEGEYSDYVTHALNSSWGKAISAFIFLALRIVRVNDKKGGKKNIKWDNNFREKYNTLLDKGIIEAYTWLSNYLPQLKYIDDEWAKQKIVDLDGKKLEKIWVVFMNGYLYGGRVYEDLYELMRPHYEYGINYDFKESHDRQRLIQHISIGYLRGQEALEGSKSLFRKVLDQWNHEKIREIITYFWMQRDYATLKNEDSEKTRQKIIEFWKWLFDYYQSKEVEQFDKSDKLLLSDLSKLTIFLPEINDDNYLWLLQTAPYVKENFNSPFFIEYLDGLKGKGDKVKTACFIGDIFLKMLEHFTPDYDTSHICSIVGFLYEAKATEKAIEICNIYGSRGYEFLRDIYEKHNKGRGMF